MIPLGPNGIVFDALVTDEVYLLPLEKTTSFMQKF